MTRFWTHYAARMSASATQGQQYWQHSIARRWLHAWLAELVGMLPGKFAARLSKRDEVQLLAWPLPDTIETERPAVLLLSAQQVMAQRISLPIAATRNLNRVLQYELDKYTPYPSEQVHFVARVVRKHATHAEVELVAVAKEHLNNQLDACRERGLHLVALDAQDSAGQRRGINLLPAGAGQGSVRTHSVNRWLWASCLTLCMAIASMYVHQRQQLLVEMRNEVAGQREQVQHLQRVRQQLNDTVGASRYLADLKASRPTMSLLLAELTACLGEENWISQLEVQDGVNVTFSGQSPRASVLITQIQTCPSLEQVQFQGIIRPDDTTGNERFSIGARLKQEGTHANSD